MKRRKLMCHFKQVIFKVSFVLNNSWLLNNCFLDQLPKPITQFFIDLKNVVRYRETNFLYAENISKGLTVDTVSPNTYYRC